MVYKIVSVESDGKKYLWGTFSRDKEKMFLFVSYLMSSNNPEIFYIIEEETNKVMSLLHFADHYGITKDDIKKHK